MAARDEDKKGMIFDIKELAVFDGPGIRTTVFLKGCPLHCNWCHNPEGMSMKRQLMVSHNGCLHCSRCQLVCLHKETGCELCGKCISICPMNLRKICGEEITAGDLAQKLLSDKEFFLKNGGGITFSGGEPLAQHEFLLSVLKKLKGLHRAIETSGYSDDEVFVKVSEELELIIMDLKMMDSGKHKKYTGVENQKILRNLEYLKKSGKPFLIRVPLIPGVNDTIDNLDKTAEALEGSKNLIKVELLPYHRTAGAKYSMLGEEYHPIFQTEQEPTAITQCFKKRNIPCTVL